MENVMTTTVRVQARAWGARVEVNGETTEVGANQEHNIHIPEGESVTLTVTHGERPAENAEPFAGEEVPGRAENDRLVPPVGNESGATETAQTNDGTEGGQPEATAPAGRGRRDRSDG
jgi:hypothetical protein